MKGSSNMNIIALIRSTINNQLNLSTISRRVTAEEVSHEVNKILEGSETVTPNIVRAYVQAGWLNTKGVQEFEVTQGRYGGIREVNVKSLKQSKIKNTPQEAADVVVLRPEGPTTNMVANLVAERDTASAVNAAMTVIKRGPGRPRLNPELVKRKADLRVRRQGFAAHARAMRQAYLHAVPTNKESVGV